MPKRYALIRADGTFEITATPDDAADLVALVPIPADADLSDRTFRNAWTIKDGNKVVCDMDKARTIWRGKLEWAREQRMAGLDRIHARLVTDAADKEMQPEDRLAKRADADKIDKERKQVAKVLDDPKLKNAKTPEDLKAFWPECLGCNNPAR